MVNELVVLIQFRFTVAQMFLVAMMTHKESTFNLTSNVSSENGVQIVNGHNYDIDPTQNA